MGRTITLEQFTRARKVHPEHLFDWARRNKQRGGIIEIVVKNDQGTVVDLLEYDLNEDGEKYLNADRTAGAQSWARDVAVTPLDVTLFDD